MTTFRDDNLIHDNLPLGMTTYPWHDNLPLGMTTYPLMVFMPPGAYRSPAATPFGATASISSRSAGVIS